jgi:hypothetical protein
MKPYSVMYKTAAVSCCCTVTYTVSAHNNLIRGTSVCPSVTAWVQAWTCTCRLLSSPDVKCSFWNVLSYCLQYKPSLFHEFITFEVSHMIAYRLVFSFLDKLMYLFRWQSNYYDNSCYCFRPRMLVYCKNCQCWYDTWSLSRLKPSWHVQV